MSAILSPCRTYRFLLDTAARSSVVIAAWGTMGEFLGRDQQVKAMIPGLHILAVTKGGHPNHPLYLKGDLVPLLWSA